MFTLKNLRQKRKEKKISQQQLAERCELARETISRLETGKHQNFTVKLVKKLAAGLEISPMEFLDDESA